MDEKTRPWDTIGELVGWLRRRGELLQRQARPAAALAGLYNSKSIGLLRPQFYYYYYPLEEFLEPLSTQRLLKTHPNRSTLLSCY